MTSASHLEQAAFACRCQPAGVLHSVLTWAQRAPSSLWAAAVGTAAEMREGSKPQQRETLAFGREGVMSHA